MVAPGASHLGTREPRTEARCAPDRGRWSSSRTADLTTDDRVRLIPVDGTREWTPRSQGTQTSWKPGKPGTDGTFPAAGGYGPTAVSGPSCPSLTSYDNGNVFKILDNVTSAYTQTFGYDTLNRIASYSDVGGHSQTFSIDAWGNMVQSGTLASGLAFGGTKNQDTSGTLTYDSAGNVLSSYNGATRSYFTWDAAEQMLGETGVSSYVYDADGNRVRKTVGSSWTDYVYFGGQPVAEQTSAGTYTDYIFANGKRLALSAGTSTSNYSTTALSYYHEDAIGSTSVTTDSSANTLSSNEYYPFGAGPQPTGNNHYLFTGKERDTESGNDYFGARYYASTMGRFMSPDWAGQAETVPYASLPNPQSLNLYAYVGNNPITRADRDGHLYGDAVGSPSVWEGNYQPGDDDPAEAQPGQPAPPPPPPVPPPAQQTVESLFQFRDPQNETASTFPAWDSRNDVLGILGGSNSCSDWLKQGNPNAYEIMSKVRITMFNADPSVGGKTLSGNTTSPIEVNANGSFYASNRGAPNYGPYSPGTFGARMVILLHELAHKVLALGFDNSLFENEEKNNGLVLHYCQPVIDSYGRQW